MPDNGGILSAIKVKLRLSLLAVNVDLSSIEGFIYISVRRDNNESDISGFIGECG